MGLSVAGTLERGGDLARGQVPSMDGPERLLGHGRSQASRTFCSLLDRGGLGIAHIF
jgi:hypothetical protein